MTTKYYTGNAIATAQVNTITPANVNIGNTFTLTMNGKSVTFTATAATVANVTAGLLALVQASGAPAEFFDMTWADNTTNLTATSNVAGRPFTQTSSASGGTATLVTVTTTANSGPNDASVGANWSGGTIPANGDDVIIDGLTTSQGINYGLDQSGVSLASMTIRNGYIGKIGLSEVNAAGYQEYRAKYLKYAFASGSDIDISCQSDQIKLDCANSVVDIFVSDTASTPFETGSMALVVHGTTGATTFECTKGNVGFAVISGTTTGVATANIVGTSANVLFGTGCALTTVNGRSGSAQVVNQATTITTLAITGAFTFETAGNTITTLTNYGGSVYYTGAGTIGSYTGGNGSLLDTSRDPSARTITNSTFYRGARVNDPYKTITWTNASVTNDMRMGDLASSDFGLMSTLKVT